ncbi:MAG TPA: hypothetical protein VF210_12930 [Pseudomonadales bacterium]
MSDDRSDSKTKGERTPSDLLGDLESIRSLLDDDADDDVPLLEDVVHGGVSVNETFLAGEGDFSETGDPSSGLNDDLFKALLSDEWRESARELLDEARAAIERHQAEWTPRHTDELNQALRARIDSTVQEWLQAVVRERVDELRQTLLAAVSEQIRSTIAEQFGRDAKDEDTDGA